jgi:glycosyltransferase involved in cell wall biosynthesis
VGESADNLWEIVRIIHLITHLRLGAGRAIVDLAMHQADAGSEVVVGMADDAEGNWRSDPRLIHELEQAGIRTLTLGDFFHRDARLLREAAARLRAAAGSWESTVVHAHAAMGVAAARWAGAPAVIATCHGWSPDRAAAFDLQDALAFSLADAIISPSAYWARRVAELSGASGARLHVIPNGVDLRDYPAVRRDSRGGNARRIACVGELTHRKGQDVLLDAMPLIWAHEPSAELHLFGDGDLADVIRARARALDPDGRRVIVRGHVPRPYTELASFDVFCLPTRSDNQPLAIVEALLAGVPVVATDVGGIPEMITGPHAGAVVPPDAAAPLAEAVLRVGKAQRPAAMTIRLEAEATYSLTACAARTVAVYRTALSQCGSKA